MNASSSVRVREKSIGVLAVVSAITGLCLPSFLNQAEATGNAQRSTAGNPAAAAAKRHPLPEMLAGQAAPPQRGPEYEPGEILVKLKKGSLAALALEKATKAKEPNLQSALKGTALGALFEKHSVSELKPAFRVVASPKPAKAVITHPKSGDQTREDLFRWYRLRLPADVDPVKAGQALKAHTEIDIAEPNILYHLAYDIPPPITSTNLPTVLTDPGFDEQWHHTAAKIPNAWQYLDQMGQYPGGSRDVFVAVIDSGIDVNHEDLVANLWTNSGEIPGNEVDDDGNGFVDDIHGCSVVADIRSHSGDPADYHGHGTYVSGIIAATAFNHKGGVGVAFNVQVMAVRAAQYSGTLTSLDIAEGVLYAVDNGAEVINMSFGGYGRSQLMEDALEVALSQAVLVAAAGNNSGPQMFPAALPWVIGVAASTPAGRKAWFSNAGDVLAPGESIYSTLPGNGYAAWSGTSMAAPVVSGIGALMRSFFWQRDIYSVRFLMGGLYAAGADAYRALTVLPTPGVTVVENWLFDDQSIDPGNDADGRVDAGETLHLAIEVINRSGMVKNVQATLRAYKDGAIMDDPYVTILNGAANFGDIGPWNTADNGFIYNSEGVITGVASPLVFRVDPNCPNDHIIPFIMQITFQDGWDTNLTSYTRYSRFNYIVQRGKNVPGVISTNFTLTADEYWMVAGPVLVEPGATLTIEPGTQVQWGAVSDDPYNPGPQTGYIIVRGALVAHGTLTNPISLFPSYLVSGQTTRITVDPGGAADLSYVKVRNPDLTGLRGVDHAYLEWDAYSSNVRAMRISNTIFHKFRGGGQIEISCGLDTCLFDAGWILPPNVFMENCTFLQDNENNVAFWFAIPNSYSSSFAKVHGWVDYFYSPFTTNGETLVLAPTKGGWRLAETMARYYGGHLMAIRNPEDWNLVQYWLPSMPPLGSMTWFVVGMRNTVQPWQYAWLDGSPLTFEAWRSGEPSIPFME